LVAKLSNTLAAAALAASMLHGAASAAQEYGLEELRAEARAQHPTLASAQAAIDAAEALLRQQRLLEDPVTRFESGAAESGAESGTEWSLEVSQRIPLLGHRRWRIRSSEAGVERARSDHLGLEALVEYEVGRLWVEAVLAERTAEVAAQGEAIAEQLLVLIERRVEAGEAPPLETLRARTEWFERRRLSLESTRRLASAKEALDIFCHRSLGRDFELLGELDSLGALPPLEELAARLLDANPLLLSQRASVAESEALRAVEQRGSLPDFEFSVSRESELDKDATIAGVALRIPIWNRNQAAIAAADANLNMSRALLSSLTLDLELELEQAIVDYRVAAEALALYEAGWRAAAFDAVEIAGFSFEHGESSLLELLDAQRSFLEVGLAEAETRARLTLARLRIEYLVGEPLNEVHSDES
jgi:outer membrane protein, heavy metal efflux system